MRSLSYVTTEGRTISQTTVSIPTDESIGAMLFDISGFNNPFDGHSLLYYNFKDNTTQCIKNIDDAAIIGIVNDGFLNGMLYYHIKQFYDLIGTDQALYICIADCSKDWSVIQQMQRDVNGKLFHVGVWTSQPIWSVKDDGSMAFTRLITDLQEQADEINGKVGQPTFSAIPLSIMLCGNSNYIENGEINYKLLPDAKVLGCQKVSVFLTQNGSDEVHKMQENNPNKAPVSALGFIMACLSICGAEESIASVKSCDLNVNEDFNNPEWGFGKNGLPIDNITRIQANIVSQKGYIIPISYEEMEASYFFSSDQTLGNGVFDCISNNRIMHKCRRAMCTALMPYINSDQLYDPSTQSISATASTVITDSVNVIIDSVMRNKKGNKQIDGRTVEVESSGDLLNKDILSLKLTIVSVSNNDILQEVVSHDVNQ